MAIIRDNSEKDTFEQLASSSGLAIAIVDDTGRELFTANNNSICRSLNPTGKLSEDCARFCGKALEKVSETGKSIRFECHAGLDCRAVPVKNPNIPLVAIVGRTFTKAENYRLATERAISGDWIGQPPAKFFENILLASSGEILDRTAKKVKELIAKAKAEKLARRQRSGAEQKPKTETRPVATPTPAASKAKPVQPTTRPGPPALQAPEPAAVKKSAAETSNLVKKFNREILLEPIVETPRASEPVKMKPPADLPNTGPSRKQRQAEAKDPEPRTEEKKTSSAQAWRAFFGSLLKTDYTKASESILEFVAAHYGYSSLVWLDKKENRLENTVAFGEMKSRKVRLGIAADDHRLVDAAEHEIPLELGERAGSGKRSRIMNLFPIAVGGEISAAIAVIDAVRDEHKKQLVRMCGSIAPQLEILRLRSEVSRRESLAGAIDKFSQSLRLIDDNRFWLKLLQNTAEFMGAERASLLIYNEKTDKLDVKAVVGVKNWSRKNGEIGGRVAKVVLNKNFPVTVADIASTGLPPAAREREYKTSSFACFPITIGERPIGVMNFTDRADGGTFDRRSLELFQTISAQLAVAIDRARLKNKAGEFEQLSVTDSLTGLLNRRYIEARLAEEIQRSTRHGFPMSFIMLDVDNFKSYNDEFGHPAGDEALKLVGNVIRETLRGADVAARFGGEEFAILLPQTTADEAIAIGERIRHNIEKTAFPHRRVTASIGIASCSAELCVSTDVVSAADQALYEAKRRGRNRVLAFEEISGHGGT